MLHPEDANLRKSALGKDFLFFGSRYRGKLTRKGFFQAIKAEYSLLFYSFYPEEGQLVGNLITTGGIIANGKK
jgi:hypothetical protein